MRRWLLACVGIGLALGAGARARAEEDLDSVLGGFEHQEPAPAAADAGASDERIWDLSGSVELSGSVNYRSHHSDTGTDYAGLQRLRNRANLQLDVNLPAEWKLRAEGWAFYDAAYAINGRGDYTGAVRREYEWDAQVGEAWVAGALGEHVDLAVGRQVVAWGRSETLRVLDVLNPLDNREPGRVDLEDIRLPVSMVNLKGYAGDWSAALMAIPEIRFDQNPVVGSDFFPGAVDLPERKPHSFQDTEVAGAINGIFSGWDVSFHGAWFWNDLPRPDGAVVPTRLVHDRLWMVGSGGNYTRGPWLLKTELAYLDGLGFFGTHDKSRFDALVGAEYYGIADTTFIAEVVERHLFDYERAVRRAPNYTREDAQEIALRLSRDFWNDTLHATLVGIVLGWDARDGSIARFDLDYDVLDALTVGVGLLLYQRGDLPPLDAWGDNDRVIFNVKWSF
ncbi:MAG TPA: DUF1302 family protein [Myxococcota bacterium]|nr:DUF1302 family protein [Myxococcota bacterium]